MNLFIQSADPACVIFTYDCHLESSFFLPLLPWTCLHFNQWIKNCLFFVWLKSLWFGQHCDARYNFLTLEAQTAKVSRELETCVQMRLCSLWHNNQVLLPNSSCLITLFCISTVKYNQYLISDLMPISDTLINIRLLKTKHLKISNWCMLDSPDYSCHFLYILYRLFNDYLKN